MQDLGLGLPLDAFVFRAQPFDLFLEARDGLAASLRVLRRLVQFRGDRGDLGVLFGDPELPPLFLFLVEVLDVHQLHDRREIVVRSHGASSLGVLDLRKELPELQGQVFLVRRDLHRSPERDPAVDEQGDQGLVHGLHVVVRHGRLDLRQDLLGLAQLDVLGDLGGVDHDLADWRQAGPVGLLDQAQRNDRLQDQGEL